MAEKKQNLPAKMDQVIDQLEKGRAMGCEALQLEGFQRAYKTAEATKGLEVILTDEYMKPFMALQNSKLGFKTDKENGYPVQIVKRCLIEAVLTGVQPSANQFNIIAGNCYITKEGFGYLLKNMKGLSYKLKPQLPRIKDTSAAIIFEISWSINGSTWQKEDVDFPVKVNKYMGADAVIGKGTRKARAWLYNHITGSEVADGDAADLKEEIKGKPSMGNTFAKAASEGAEKVEDIAHEEVKEEKKDPKNGELNL